MALCQLFACGGGLLLLQQYNCYLEQQQQGYSCVQQQSNYMPREDEEVCEGSSIVQSWWDVYWKSIPLCLLAFQLSDSGLQRWHQTNRKILSSRVTGSTQLLSIIFRLPIMEGSVENRLGNQTPWKISQKSIRNFCANDLSYSFLELTNLCNYMTLQ